MASRENEEHQYQFCMFAHSIVRWTERTNRQLDEIKIILSTK